MTALLATLYHSILCDYCLLRAKYYMLHNWIEEGYNYPILDTWLNRAEYHLKTLFAIEEVERA
jgi:hypothetical protein